MKKLTMLLCMVMVFMISVTMVSAAENIEIVFCVGDSTLSINGEDVTVETPYVVDGTTLVPVRVITEAFGAEVGWEDATRTVTIAYSDVTISLSIGSDKAYINGAETTLLAAPELTNSTTMVPLRFITETFGADVSYDEATEGITVIKEMTESNSIKDYSLILKRSTKEYVGDSYLGWSMQRSPALKLVERSFDGWYNMFTDSNTGAILEIEKLTNFEGEDQVTVDTVLNLMRELSSGYTVNRLDTAKTAQGYEYATLIFRSSTEYSEIMYFFNGEEVYCVSITMDIAQNQKDFNALTEIAETFDFVFTATTTEDLSDVNKNTNMHTFKSDFMNLEMDIPGNLVVVNNTDMLNGEDFYEMSDSNAGLYDDMGVRMYSIVDGKDAEYWANEDLKYNKFTTSGEYFTYSNVKTMMVNGKYAWYYTSDYNYNKKTYIKYDVFVDNGDYFYNIFLQFEKSNLSTLEKILDSVKFGEVNKDDVGTLLRTSTGELTYKDFTIDTTPVAFKGPDSNWTTYDINGGKIFTSGLGSITVMCQKKADLPSNVTPVVFTQTMIASLSSNTELSDVTSTQKRLQEYSEYTYKIEYKHTMDDMIYECTCYIIDKGDYYVLCDIAISQPHDSEYTDEVIKTIVDSLAIPK